MTIAMTMGPVWLEVERLARKEPPAPPENIVEWMAVPATQQDRRKGARSGLYRHGGRA